MKPWLRNTVFIALLSGVTVLVVQRILKPRPFLEPRSFQPSEYDRPEFNSVVARLDQAFEAQWQSAGIRPASRASDLTTARRLSLGLTGTIPSLEEIRAFEKRSDRHRLQWWLSHLLEDRRSSDYLAERFARAWVGVEMGPFIVYRRHRLVSWLSDQIQRNEPYDRIVRRLITSEGIWTSRPEVNFITVTVDPNNDKEGPDETKLAGRVARAFLGVRLDCVQCHDDFLGDRWKQQDFHRLAAFFAKAEMSLTGVRDTPSKEYEFRYLGKSDKELVPPAVPFASELLPGDGALRDRLAGWVTHPDNRPFARALVNRVWALLFNRPLVPPIDEIPLEGPLPPAMEILADDLIAHGFDLHRLIRVIAATRVFQLDSRGADETLDSGPLFASFPITRLRSEQVAGSVLQSSKLKTINSGSHVLTRIVRYFQQGDFVKRYGDPGEDEFEPAPGTILQRLMLMNGDLVFERTREDAMMNASTRVGALAPDNATAVETAYLATLTRRPTPEERDHFLKRLQGGLDMKRSQLMEDLFWTLINSTEFSWNH